MISLQYVSIYNLGSNLAHDGQPNKLFGNNIVNVLYTYFMNIPKFIMAILLIIPGAFMIADGVLSFLGGTAIFFIDVNMYFELVVGFAVIVLGASQLDSKRSD